MRTDEYRCLLRYLGFMHPPDSKSPSGQEIACVLHCPHLTTRLLFADRLWLLRDRAAQVMRVYDVFDWQSLSILLWFICTVPS